MKFMRSVPLLLCISYALMGLVLAINFTKLPPEAPLFYSLPLASSHVVDIWYIGIIPVVSLLCVGLNTWGIKRLLKSEEFAQTLLYAVNCIVIALSTYLFIRIILLIT